MRHYKIMRHFLIYSLSLLCMLVSACTTSKSTVSSTADMSKYRYASVINNDTYHIPAELIEYEIQLFDAIESSRLQLVNDMRIYELTPQQQEELLLVKYGVNQNNTETIVTVNFIDYMTGRPVASCRGAFGLGIDQDKDLKGAIKRVAKQISDTFPPKP